MNNKLGGLVGKVGKYDAVFSLVNGDMYQKADGTMHYTGGKTAPSNAEIDAEIIRLQSEWDAYEYARNREKEYPDMGSQLNKIYDDGVTKWKSEMVDPIKAKWPKDNSGPV